MVQARMWVLTFIHINHNTNVDITRVLRNIYRVSPVLFHLFVIFGKCL